MGQSIRELDPPLASSLVCVCLSLLVELFHRNPQPFHWCDLPFCGYCTLLVAGWALHTRLTKCQGCGDLTAFCSEHLGFFKYLQNQLYSTCLLFKTTLQKCF